MPEGVVTVRIPELLGFPDPLSLSDKLPIWIAGINKTRHTSLSAIRELLVTGGITETPPIYVGGNIYHTVTAGEAGDGFQTVLSVAALAGKQFNLRRDGRDLEPDVDFQILAGGGMKLLRAGDYLIEGQQYVFELFQMASGPGTGSGDGSLYSGILRVETNRVMSVSDVNKIVQLRGGANSLTLQLPDVSLVPANSVIIVESWIGNTKQNRIQTTGGQYVYFNNANYNSFYIGLSEMLMLYPGSDGWYPLNDFGDYYRQVGSIRGAYKVGLDELVCDGSLVSRADNWRLWEYAQTLGSSFVADSTWQLASTEFYGRTVLRPYRGCFSNGDGSTTFRLPDLMNVALRGIKSMTGLDAERYLNKPGGFQRNELESHVHSVKPPDAGSDVGYGKTVTSNAAPEGTGIAPYNTVATGGTETRMDNVGVIWVVKR